MFQNRERQNMVKKTGKSFIYFVLCLYTSILFAQDKQVRLSVYDLQKNPVNQVEVGVPFFLEIATSQFQQAQTPQDLPEFENFVVTPYNTQQSFVSVNGKQSNQTTFSYIVTPEKKGSFTLGPITIHDNNKDSITSNKLNIIVGDTTIAPVSKQQQPYLLQTIIDSKSVYVGQKTKVIIRFCYKDDYSGLSFMDAAINNFHRGFVSSTMEHGSTKIHDEDYQYQQIIMELFPEKTGLLTIPMFQAAFIPAMRYQLGFGLQMQRAVQSSPRSLEVKALPINKQHKDVSAIGIFDSISFSLHQTKGNVGEGIAATMIVQGNGNLEIAKAPELQLPDGLHCYEGNSSIERVDHEKSRKKFEWIIQADKPGHFSIDAQTFVYFDPSSQSYKTLTTNQSFLKITEGGSTKKTIEPTKPEQKDDSKNNLYAFKQDEINYINTNDPLTLHATSSHTTFNRMLTWLIMLLCFLTACIMTSWILVSYFGSSIRHAYLINYLHYRYLFYQCTRRKDLQKLHQLFIQLAQQYDIDLQGQKLSECFKRLKQPADTFEKWQHFLQLILTANFAGKQINEKQQNEIFMQASYWFSALLSCCKLQKSSYADKSIVS